MCPEELEEKDFIQESYQKNPFPFWFWSAFLIIIIIFALSLKAWYSSVIFSKVEENPFLQVTNRELSVFLWQFPEYMRINSKTKSGYLPGFQYLEKVSMETEMTDQFALAPPELIFHYHVWNRLIRNEYTLRSISLKEFRDFLEYAPEWLPENWPKAPKEYIQFIHNLSKTQSENLNNLSESTLPVIVRQSFIGWKNYLFEGDSINALILLQTDVQNFLDSHPHYARNYWRNLVKETTPSYLISFNGKINPDATTVSNEISAFLRVALYNYLQAMKEQSDQESTSLNPRS